MNRNRSPDVEEDPAPKRARGPRPAVLADVSANSNLYYVRGLDGAPTTDDLGVRAGDAHAVAPAPGPATAHAVARAAGTAMAIDLTGSCSKQRCGWVDDADEEEDDDFCEIVSEVTVPKGAAGGKREKPWYDLTTDSDDDSCCLYERITIEDEDDVVFTSPVTAAAAAGPSSEAAVAAATPAESAAAAAASVAAATAAAIAAKTLQQPSPLGQPAAADAAGVAGISNGGAAVRASGAGAGPSCPCPGCLVNDPGVIQRCNMRVAELQLNADVSTAGLLPPDPDADPSVAVLTGGRRCCTDCRRLAALAVVEAAQERFRRIVNMYQMEKTRIQGFTFEVHHAASFNIAAIRAGSLLRAECMEFAYADVRIYDVMQPAATLAMAQLKASRNPTYLNRLDAPKYAELLKVVPKGMEAPAKGRRSVLSYEGVSSSPIDLPGLKWAVTNPGDHFFDLAWAA